MDEFIANIRKAADKYGRHVAIVQDLQGPKIRPRRHKKTTISKSTRGDDLILDYAVKEHDGGLTIPVQYNLAEKVKVGEPVYIFDGKIFAPTSKKSFLIRPFVSPPKTKVSSIVIKVLTCLIPTLVAIFLPKRYP